MQNWNRPGFSLEMVLPGSSLAPPWLLKKGSDISAVAGPWPGGGEGGADTFGDIVGDSNYNYSVR